MFGKLKKIILGDDFGEGVVKANGASVQIHADGRFEGGPVKDTTAKKKAVLQVGDLDDGGVYVGPSAENGKPLHAALTDLPDYKTYEEALAAAKQLKSLHPTAHVPTPKELDKNLFDNRNTGHLKGTFNTTGLDPGSVYRSSASYGNFARVQWFDYGLQNYHGRNDRLPVRLVW